MAHEDSHTVSFNMTSSIGSTTRIPILFPSDYEVWALHFEDYVLGLEEDGAMIWNAITVGPHVHAATRREVKTLADYTSLITNVADIPVDQKVKLMSNVKAMRIIRFALPTGCFRLVSSYDTAKGIWDRLKELYSGDADLEHSVQTNLLSEFGAFSQKSGEKIDQVFDRFNHLLSRMLKYKLERTSIEQKVTFLNSLNSEWKMIVSTVKAHEQFKNYSLAKMVGILRSHEEDVARDNSVSKLGSLAHVGKGKKISEDSSESEISDDELSKEDKALLVSNPKKFYKKNFSRLRNRNFSSDHRNNSSDRKQEGSFKSSKGEADPKPTDDSGYDCHYCKGKNHLAQDCMLRKLHEKNSKVKDEAYYARKIEELKKKDVQAAKLVLMVQEDSEFGTTEVWSTDSEDEEVRRPTHGRCLMVQDCQTSSSCFATRPVSEQVREVEDVVNKIG